MKYQSHFALSALVTTLMSTALLANATTNKAAYLFTQAAKAVSVVACKDKSQCDDQVTFSKLNDQVTYFSDRPARLNGEVGLSSFLQKWAKGANNFKQDHPNASLVYFDGTKMKQHIVELSHPHYDAAKNTLTYNVKLLSQTTMIPGQYMYGVLFIDSWQWF